MQTPATMRDEVVRVECGDVVMACRVAGATGSPAVVLLHALGEQSTTWDDLTPRLADSFRTHAFDLRGHGLSGWTDSYSLEQMRDDVLAAIDRLALAPVTLVGHSMGAIVAYLVAMQRPHVVERLVLEEPVAPLPRDHAIPQRPSAPLGFDWAVVPAIVGQVNSPDPTWWTRLAEITAPTLLVGGGADSHVPQDKLAMMAARCSTTGACRFSPLRAQC